MSKNMRLIVLGVLIVFLGLVVLSLGELAVLGSGAKVASVGDFVWDDQNENGIQDESEPGVAGVMLVLMDNGPFVPVKVAEAVSQSDGRYEFVGVAAGRYGVNVDMTTLPEGATITLLQQGDDRALDSDFSTFGGTFAFRIADGDVQSTVDPGLLVPEVATTPAATPTATATRVATAVAVPSATMTETALPSATASPTATVMPNVPTGTPEPTVDMMIYLPFVGR